MDSIKYYNENAHYYFDITKDVPMNDNMNQFLSYLPEHSSILDFGCGSGRDIYEFKKRRYEVDGIDGSIELCKLASEYTGVEIKCVNFLDFEPSKKYDGIWACASLLHLKRDDIPIIIKKLYDSLNEKGILYLSMKKGEKESFIYKRFFTFVKEEELKQWTNNLFIPLDIHESKDNLSDRQDVIWINAFFKKI